MNQTSKENSKVSKLVPSNEPSEQRKKKQRNAKNRKLRNEKLYTDILQKISGLKSRWHAAGTLGDLANLIRTEEKLQQTKLAPGGPSFSEDLITEIKNLDANFDETSSVNLESHKSLVALDKMMAKNYNGKDQSLIRSCARNTLARIQMNQHGQSIAKIPPWEEMHHLPEDIALKVYYIQIFNTWLAAELNRYTVTLLLKMMDIFILKDPKCPKILDSIRKNTHPSLVILRGINDSEYEAVYDKFKLQLKKLKVNCKDLEKVKEAMPFVSKEFDNILVNTKGTETILIDSFGNRVVSKQYPSYVVVRVLCQTVFKTDSHDRIFLVEDNKYGDVQVREYGEVQTHEKLPIARDQSKK